MKVSDISFLAKIELILCDRWMADHPLPFLDSPGGLLANDRKPSVEAFPTMPRRAVGSATYDKAILKGSIAPNSAGVPETVRHASHMRKPESRPHRSRQKLQVAQDAYPTQTRQRDRIP